ncbi:hypothetical protein PVL29_012005 [Vitis rotundifolia]|uniref:Uncharacterized protein n=1 Tax=Vitis rotundifolia TaxID=103349 RepID=A0AA38ZPW1_VITRO|nr:hypothetical protein PVL29_012005 [Vitis rotundifolia]
MVFGRVPQRRSYSSRNRRIAERRKIESVRLLENKRKKASYTGDYRRRNTIRASIGEYRTDRKSNRSKYRRIQARNYGIHASTGEEIVSGRVSENNKQTGNQSMRAPQNPRHRGWYPGEFERGDRIRGRQTDEESNPCDYWRIKERKHPLRATTKEEILSGRVLENIEQTENSVGPSTRESKLEMMVSGRVSEKRSYSGEHRKITDRRGINPYEYHRIQDRKDGIRASTTEEIVFEREPKNNRQMKNRIHATTGE